MPDPQQEEMPVAPADAEERPEAPADAEALTGERALWERREKGWEKQRGELQQQVTAMAQVRAVGGGGRG